MFGDGAIISQDIKFNIIRSARKTLSIEVTPTGEILARAPFRLSEKRINKFVQQKQAWINKTLIKILANKKSKKQYIAGEEFLYLGEKYKLRIIDDNHLTFSFNNEFLLVKEYIAEAEELFIDWYKKQAKTIVINMAEKLASKHQLNYKQIKISNAKTRWGSCSNRGNLNFSWRLIMAPKAAIEYVIVHELAHLEHLNHSKAFWHKVASMLPDYKMRRQWFKDYHKYYFV